MEQCRNVGAMWILIQFYHTTRLTVSKYNHHTPSTHIHTSCNKFPYNIKWRNAGMLEAHRTVM